MDWFSEEVNGLPAPECILHLGAGTCRELNSFQGLNPRQIFLVEPNPNLAALLLRKTASMNNVRVVECAVSSSSGDKVLGLMSDPHFSSLCQPTRLHELMPGLVDTCEVIVKCKSVSELITDLGLNLARNNWLVVDTPGVEEEVMKGLASSGKLWGFNHVFLRAGADSYYENSGTIGQICSVLGDLGYLQGNNPNLEDADWPVHHFFLDKLESNINVLRLRLEEEKSQTALLQSKIEDMKSELSIVRKRQILGESDLQDLRVRYNDALTATPRQRGSPLTGDDTGREEPIRTIHHFACTGGTMIAKCLASMPNTQVLSEVEPHSQMELERKFSPTDLIQLVRSSSRGSNTDLDSQIFLDGLDTLYNDCKSKGLHLILRDHTHSKYCFGDVMADKPTLLELVAIRYQTRSIITVRHPLDSYLSTQKQGWLTFPEKTLEEYSRRYLQFLDDYNGIPILKYEDCVEDPDSFSRQMCKELDIAYFGGFEEVFSVHELSGDSGRSSGRVATRKRRELSPDLMLELESAPYYRSLCARLGY